MRIAVLAPVATPVPPAAYGGVEEHFSTEQLVASYEQAFVRALAGA